LKKIIIASLLILMIVSNVWAAENTSENSIILKKHHLNLKRLPIMM
jgi:hypothetical protein